MHTELESGKPEGKRLLENLDYDDIIKTILRSLDMRVWI